MRLPLTLLEVFNAIARDGSLRGAARALDVNPSTISHQLKALEDQTGTALFIRTTRTVSLTEAGRYLYQRTSPAFEQLETGLNGAKSAGQDASGSLKLAIPEFAYTLLMREGLARFQKRHPLIEVELSISDAMADILEDGFHAGFRLGGFVAQDMVAINLTGALRSCVVGSPAYFAKHGTPQTPDELLTHNCLRYRFHSSGQIAPWQFQGPDGAYSVDVKGSSITNTQPASIELAKQDLGLTFTFRDYCTTALQDGTLTEVLTEHLAPLPGVHIYFPREYRQMVPLRLLIDHLKAISQAGSNSKL